MSDTAFASLPADQDECSNLLDDREVLKILFVLVLAVQFLFGD